MAKVFIPKNIEDTGTTTAGYFTSNKKLSIVVIYITAALIIAAYNTVILTFPIAFYTYLAIVLFGLQYIIRKFVLEEKRLMTLREELKEHQITNLIPIWRISEITEEGVIKYTNLTTAVIAKIVPTSIIGKPEGFISQSKLALANTLREFLKEGYKMVIIDTSESAKSEDVFAEYDRKLKQLEKENKRAASLLKIQINHLKSISSTFADVPAMYIMIYTSSYKKGQNIVDDVIRLSGQLQLSMFTLDKILNRSEILQLLCKLNHITVINYMDLINSIAQQEVKLENPFTVVKRFDKNMVEELEIEIDIEPESQAVQKEEKRRSLLSFRRSKEQRKAEQKVKDKTTQKHKEELEEIERKTKQGLLEIKLEENKTESVLEDEQIMKRFERFRRTAKQAFQKQDEYNVVDGYDKENDICDYEEEGYNQVYHEQHSNKIQEEYTEIEYDDSLKETVNENSDDDIIIDI